MEPRLKSKIIKEINPSLKELFGYRNLYMGPKIEKIVLNMGFLHARVAFRLVFLKSLIAELDQKTIITKCNLIVT